jgi:ribosome-associated protein
LDKIITTIPGKKKTSDRITKNNKFYKTIIHAIQEKKGDHVVSLDLRKIDEAVADFFILCDAKSNVQCKAIADFVIETLEKTCDERPYRTEYGDKWTLIDYVNVVVHVFQHEHRVYYNLENLWADAPRTEY